MAGPYHPQSFGRRLDNTAPLSGLRPDELSKAQPVTDQRQWHT